MSLRNYRQKRDFERTREPKGHTRQRVPGCRYVVHKHAASRLHYDLRLEVDGVLKSWAVPKGPSLDPGDKRLAVQVEDHPIEYGDFEGTIPAGEYGGGTVMIWDRGTWEPADDARAGLERGRLKFRLAGRKLRGGWTLVRMGGAAGAKGKKWLLIKERDDEVRPQTAYDVTTRLPDSVASGRAMDDIAAGAKRRRRGVAQADGRARSKAANPASRRNATPRRASERAAAGRQKRASRGSAALDPASVPGARRARQPDFLPPQLATLAAKIPSSAEWLHEVKFDGYRMLGVLEDGTVRMMSRNGHDWTNRVRSVARAVEALPVERAIIDGEVVVQRPDGTTDFQALQNGLKQGDRAHLVYYTFDLPHCGGYDLTDAPLLARKEVLERLVRAPADSSNSVIRFSEHVQGGGPAVFERACVLKLEGIVSKRADSPYEQRRSRSWLKVKCGARQEFVIGGYSDPAGSRTGFGALVLGYYDQGRLVYCGRVGTGFNERSLRTILKELERRATAQPPFDNPPVGAEARGIHWVRPELVAEVQFNSWTSAGILRQAAFLGLRPDKDARAVVRERPAAPDTEGESPDPHAGRRSRKIKRAAAAKLSVAEPSDDRVAGIQLTHPERIMFPEQRITKRALAAYYERVADWILPHIAGRPLSIVRCPQGRQGNCFFQKHSNETLGDAIRGVKIRDKEGEAIYIVVDDLPGLVTLVQFGALELHPWGSRSDDVERPDRVIFDLDPGTGVVWEAVITAAKLVHDRLEDLGLRSFVKTSGGKGLHVEIPIARRVGWDEVKAFAQGVAVSIARESPQLCVANMSKSQRAGRIFIDYLRNGRGATSVAPYSTRARENAPVSTPVAWNELNVKLGPGDFTAASLPARLAGLKRDPWAGFFELRQSLTAGIQRKMRAVAMQRRP